MKQVLFIVLLAGCLVGFAGNEAASTISKDDKAAIESFFKEFREACNDKDVEKVKKMLGNNWNDWACNIDNGVKFESIEILDVVTGRITNVVAKVSAVDKHGNRSSPQMVFTMVKLDGVYSIGKIVIPRVDKRNQDVREAFETVRKLATAINTHDMGSAQELLSFKDAADFEKELSSRGLAWIKEMIENKVTIPVGSIGAGYEERNRLIGRIDAPVVFGGANVLRRFYFMDGKIDRVAPRRVTKEEFLKRFEKEKEESRRKYQAEKQSKSVESTKKRLNLSRSGSSELSLQRVFAIVHAGM